MTLPTIYELGFDPLLNRGLPTMPDVLQSSISNNISTGVLGSGEMIGNYTIKDGYFQSSNFVSGSAGWQLSPTGAEINVSTAILSLDIPDATTASSFHTDSDGNSYWGCNVADFATDNDNAKAYILKTGVAKLQDVSVVGTISGRSTATIASAINASGNFIDANLDTSGKEILGDFTFGASGAIKMITDADNGLWISPTGILAKKAGANTFTIGIDGSPTFVGTITASAGSIGGWSIAATSLYYDGATDVVSSGMSSVDYPFYAGAKYANRATAPFRVTPEGRASVSSLARTDLHWFEMFSSLDNYGQTIVGTGTIGLNQGLALTTSGAVNDYCEVTRGVAPSVDFSWDKARIIKFNVRINYNSSQNIYLVSGSLGTYVARKMGFWIDDNIIYGWSADGADNETIQLATIASAPRDYLLVAELIPGDSVVFYVNNPSTTYSLSNYVPSGNTDAGSPIQAEVQTTTTAQRAITIGYYDFWQANI